VDPGRPLVVVEMCFCLPGGIVRWSWTAWPVQLSWFQPVPLSLVVVSALCLQGRWLCASQQ
jgi:hypothetical protein